MQIVKIAVIDENEINMLFLESFFPGGRLSLMLYRMLRTL